MKEIKNKVNTNKITEGSIFGQLLLFFFPILFGTFFQQLYNTADAVVVGRFVGKQALAAVGGTTSTLINLLVGFFVGLSSGATVVISQFYGARKPDKVHWAVHTAVAFSLIGGVLFMIIGVVFAHMALSAMHTPEDVLTYAVVYIRIYFLGMIPNLIYNMGAGILRAVGDSKRPLYFLIGSCMVNILLDLILVAGLRLGVAGAAIATISSQFFSACMVVYALTHTEDMYKLVWSKVRIDGRMLQRIVRIGIPAGMQSVMYNISNIIIQSGVNTLGTDNVTAWATYGKVDGLYWMMINALGISVTTFVGQNYGAGKKERIRTGIREGVILTILINIPLALMLLCIPEFLTSFMLNDASIISYTRDFLAVTGICLFPLGWLFVFRNGCQGMGHTFVPMLSGVLEVSLRVVMVKLLTPYLAFRGVALAEVSAWIGAWIMLMITYWIYQERTDSFR